MYKHSSVASEHVRYTCGFLYAETATHTNILAIPINSLLSTLIYIYTPAIWKNTRYLGLVNVLADMLGDA